jgi:hypothetical protein
MVLKKSEENEKKEDNQVLVRIDKDHTLAKNIYWDIFLPIYHYFFYCDKFGNPLRDQNTVAKYV